MAVAHLGAQTLAKCRRVAVIGPGAANATLLSMRSRVGLSAVVLALSGHAYACGSADLSSFGADATPPTTGGGAADAGFGATPTAAAGDKTSGPADNAVILVHAAKSQAFRLCFQNELDRRPQPDSELMPEANVVGVEVGGAVRLPPLRGAPGNVILFDEPAIRGSYPSFGGAGAGPSCEDLINGDLGSDAQLLGTIETNLSTGVHLVVVTGCPSDSLIRKFTAAECGAGWVAGLPKDGGKGNLAVKDIALTGTVRPADNGILPAQIVNLSQPLESARAGRDLKVTFGPLGQPSTSHVPVVTNPLLFGGAQPPVPAQLTYASQDTAVYGSFGFRVTFASPGATDAAANTTLLDESLADVQKSSSPRDIPPSYYATASNYALLLLGDPNARLPNDAGPDTDDRRALHLLAIPVIEPKSDGGADGGGAPETLDGGAASTP